MGAPLTESTRHVPLWRLHFLSGKTTRPPPLISSVGSVPKTPSPTDAGWPQTLANRSKPL